MPTSAVPRYSGAPAEVLPAHVPLLCAKRREFCERLEYDLLFKWFLDLNIMDDSFDHSMF